MSRLDRILRAALLCIGVATGASAQNVFSSSSAADYVPIVAPDSLASGFGLNLSTVKASAVTMPLPTTLGNTQVSITDSANVTASAALIYVSPTQVNYLVPATVALGKATIRVSSDTGSTQGTLLISNVAPAFFSANANGQGVPAAQFVIRDSSGNQTFLNTFQGSSGNFTPAPVSVSAGNVWLEMWGTGFRRHSANPIIVAFNGVQVPVTYAGVQSQFFGLDQLNVGPLPTTLSGSGMTNVVVTVDGIPANTLQLAIQ